MTRAPFIVAEMSANHLGDLGRALAIVDAAADAGADAIKLQTWSPGRMCISDYRLDRGPWAGRLLRELYAECFTPWSWHAQIFARARNRGLVPFSAAFDCDAVDFLETLGVDRHKVASFELVDLPLIRYMASKGKPMILSTGMASGDEVAEAWGTAAVSLGARNVTLLACTSAYPASPGDAGLKDIGKTWGCVGARFGLSDHTAGIGVSVAAVAVGAVYIEKHLTLARADGGPDAGFSLEPHEFADLVVECRRAALAVAPRPPGPKVGEDPSLRRSLWLVRDVSQGETLRLGDNVATARPALGLPPSTDMTNRRAARDLRAGEPLTAECLA